MNNKPRNPYGSYKGMYQKFYEASQHARGYDFGEGPKEKVSPPTVKGLNSLTWWSLDRPKRLAAIRRVRDQFLNEVLSLRVKPERSPSRNEGNQEKIEEESEKRRAHRWHNNRVA